MTVDRCFWCGNKDVVVCEHCGLVAYCSSSHLKIHRPKDFCFPFVVRQSAEKGRLLVATRPILPLEIVLIDTPAVVAPFNDSCLECGISLPEIPHPCSKCGLPLCGKGCEGGARHRGSECCKGKLKEWQNFDVGTAVGLIRMLDAFKKNPDVKEKVLRLMDHCDKRREEDAWKMVTDNVIPWVISQGNKEQELLERIVGIIRTNSVKWTGGIGRDVGYAVCPVFAVLNHSCISNTVEMQTQEGEMVVKASGRIEEGEEILTQYRGAALETSTRRKELLDYWKFLCDCSRCSDPTELGTMVSAVRCEECPGYFLPSTVALKTDWQCSECGKVQSGDQLDSKVQKLRQNLDSKLTVTDWEDRLCSLKEKLHENHMLCLRVKRILVSMYRGNELPRNIVDKKIEYCRNIIEVLGKLEPGYREWKAEMLEELLQPLTFTLNQDIENNNISKVGYLCRAKEVMTIMKEIGKCKEIIGKKMMK